MDEVVRSNERAGNQGDAQARARFLVDRQRSGALNEHFLAVAVKLGDEASALATNEPLEKTPKNPEEIHKWLSELGKLNPGAMKRALLALARGAYERTHEQGEDVIVRRLIELMEQHLVAVNDETRTKPSWVELGTMIEDARLQVQDREQALRDELHNFAMVVKDGSDRVRLSHLQSQLAAAVFAFDVSRAWFSGNMPSTAYHLVEAYRSLMEKDFKEYSLSPIRIRETVQKDVLPWILQEGDPVKQRVEAREQAAQAAKKKAESKANQAQQADEVRQRLDEQHPQQ